MLQFNITHIPQENIISFYKSDYKSEHRVSTIKALSTNNNPMNIVKKYLLDEIADIREFRRSLRKEFPGLFT